MVNIRTMDYYKKEFDRMKNDKIIRETLEKERSKKKLTKKQREDLNKEIEKFEKLGEYISLLK